MQHVVASSTVYLFIYIYIYIYIIRSRSARLACAVLYIKIARGMLNTARRVLGSREMEMEAHSSAHNIRNIRGALGSIVCLF